MADRSPNPATPARRAGEDVPETDQPDLGERLDELQERIEESWPAKFIHRFFAYDLLALADDARDFRFTVKLAAQAAAGLVALGSGISLTTLALPWYGARVGALYPEGEELPYADVRSASDPEAMLGEALEAGLVADAVIASSEAQAEAFWRIRDSISEAERASGGSIAHDISVPVADMPRFMTAAAAELERAFPGVEASAFGHLGDGNLHYNVFIPGRAAPLRILLAPDPAPRRAGRPDSRCVRAADRRTSDAIRGIPHRNRAQSHVW